MKGALARADDVSYSKGQPKYKGRNAKECWIMKLLIHRIVHDGRDERKQSSNSAAIECHERFDSNDIHLCSSINVQIYSQDMFLIYSDLSWSITHL